MTPPIRHFRKRRLIVQAYQAETREILEYGESTMVAYRGDFVIVGPDGIKYPCQAQAFHEIYEEVTVSSATLPPLPVNE